MSAGVRRKSYEFEVCREVLLALGPLQGGGESPGRPTSFSSFLSTHSFTGGPIGPSSSFSPTSSSLRFTHLTQTVGWASRGRLCASCSRSQAGTRYSWNMIIKASLDYAKPSQAVAQLYEAQSSQAKPEPRSTMLSLDYVVNFIKFNVYGSKKNSPPLV